MRRCVNLRKVPGWHLLEEGGGEKERGGERSGWSDAKTRNFLLQVVLEQTNSLSNVIKIFKEGKSRNWRKKWNWPPNHGVCTLKKAAQHIHRAGNPSHVLRSVFIQEETINEVPITGSLIGVCTLTFTIWKHTWLTSLSNQGLEEPALQFSLCIFTLRAVPQLKHIYAVSLKKYISSETPKTLYFWKQDLYTPDVRKEPIKPSNDIALAKMWKLCL